MPGYVAESSTGSPPARPTAAYRGLSLGQWSFWATLPALAVLGLIQAPDLLALISFTLVQTAFLAVGLWRLTLATTGLRRPAAPASVPAPDLPRYTILDQTGEAHEQSFRVCCDLAEIGICTQGQGGSRRAAEQQAAERALEALDAQARHNAPRKN